NIARSMFYFYAMYQAEADPNFWEIQKDVIYEWHYYDPVDTVESERTWEIAAYQDDCPNPFVVDSTLARRIWFYEPTSNQPEVVPASAKLNNFPNPFNPSTEIVFQLEKQPQEFPTIKIYNIKGQIIKTIEGKSHSKKQSVTWNGRSSANKSVSSGIYFYQLIVDNKVTATSKMLLLE
ncbi:MAG: T9SS type A sorting domain-containing protein, partial [Candidatus Cloacimonadota bacterium]|nr:T9SS type A sorting domain-containing protein [Candidatus Cloacimonadota bacterium]